MSYPVAQIEVLRSHIQLWICCCQEKKTQVFASGLQNPANSIDDPIEVTMKDPVTLIEMLKAMNPAIMQSLLPGEEKMKSVMSGINIVAYQARGIGLVLQKKIRLKTHFSCCGLTKVKHEFI